MNFRVVEPPGLENARSPFRVVEDSGPEVAWMLAELRRIGPAG
jgi:hypothetical protein